jgi:hypothetical protein
MFWDIRKREAQMREQLLADYENELNKTK